MEPVKDLINYKRIVNNDNKIIPNNDINDNTGSSRYRLDRNKFTPNTEDSQLADEICTKLNDQNFAGFWSVVKALGCSEARRLLANVLDDIKQKSSTKTPVRNKGAYFMWKYRGRRY